MKALTTAMGYNATLDGGVLTIHRVPIFVECTRGEHVFDGGWIKEAVAMAKLAERELYYPPLHVRHHGDEQAGVRAAGFFKILGTAPITFKGQRKTAIIADLVVTDVSVQDEVMQARLPYRSVEIFNVEKPTINGLALLDHEAPFLELPMLMVSSLEDNTPPERPGTHVCDTSEPGASGLRRVANATFSASWQMDATKDDQPVVACFSRGHHAHLLFHEEDTMTPAELAAKKAADEAAAQTAANLKADGEEGKDENMEGDDDGEGGDDTGSKLDVSAIVTAIESGEIAVKDMDAICAAIQAQGSQTEEEDTAPVANVPAPAAAPGAEAMTAKKTDAQSVEMAALAGENAALKGRMDAMDAEKKRNTDVAAAMARLEGRALGADTRAEMHKFHADHGPAAFEAYVGAMEKNTGVLPDTSGAASAFLGQSSGSKVAMKYQEEGTAAMDKAVKFSGIWADLKSRNLTRKTEEEYVAINMALESAKV